MNSQNFRRCQRGAVASEYVMLLSLIAMTFIGVAPAIQAGLRVSLGRATIPLMSTVNSFQNQGGSHISTLPGGYIGNLNSVRPRTNNPPPRKALN